MPKIIQDLILDPDVKREKYNDFGYNSCSSFLNKNSNRNTLLEWENIEQERKRSKNFKIGDRVTTMSQCYGFLFGNLVDIDTTSKFGYIYQVDYYSKLNGIHNTIWVKHVDYVMDI